MLPRRRRLLSRGPRLSSPGPAPLDGDRPCAALELDPAELGGRPRDVVAVAELPEDPQRLAELVDRKIELVGVLVGRGDGPQRLGEARPVTELAPDRERLVRHGAPA